MSYEGYYQCICEKGHRFDVDVYNKESCPCGSKTVVFNSVDETNGYDVGYIIEEDWDKFKIKEITDDNIYLIPTKEHLEEIRTYIIELKNGKITRAYCNSQKLVITSFGEYVKQARENLKLTKKEFARQVDISASFVIQIEKNKKPLPIRYWDKYVSVLKLDREKMKYFHERRL